MIAQYLVPDDAEFICAQASKQMHTWDEAWGVRCAKWITTLRDAERGRGGSLSFESAGFSDFLVDLHNHTPPTRQDDKRRLRSILEGWEGGGVLPWESAVHRCKSGKLDDAAVVVPLVGGLIKDDLKQTGQRLKSWWRGQ